MEGGGVSMFESPLAWLAVLAAVVVGLVVLQRLEFLSVFTRRQHRPPPGSTNPPDNKSSR
jgi:hypothetical protein